VISTKILPKFFKDVLQHIPTLALKSLNWKAVLKEMGPLLFRLGASELEESKRKTLTDLNLDHLVLSNYIPKSKSLDKETAQAQGNMLLKIYFAQFKNHHGLNLDIRAQHFQVKEDKLEWAPNNCWFKLDNKFRLALIDLYKGFYYKNDELFEKALASIGLSSNLDQNKKEELKALLFAHFGPGDQDVVNFKISQFSESFYELFHFFVENKVHLEKDFIFLGIYLVTLYMHLEELGESYNVREAFLEVFPQ
jgi:hypothetical protein